MTRAELSEHLKALLIPLFPASASITSMTEGNDIKFRIRWPLNNDPERVNKKSRPIHVVFSDEFVEDSTSAPINQPSTDRQISAFIEKFTTEFEPNHNHNIMSEPEPTILEIRSNFIVY